jgi:NH3-dependent NAD+ synthetase
MRKAPDPTWKTKAFFDLRTKNFLIRGCRLALADTGRLIVMMPYKEYTVRGQKKFETVIEALDVDYLEAVTAQAVEAYQEQIGHEKSHRGHKKVSGKK